MLVMALSALFILLSISALVYVGWRAADAANGSAREHEMRNVARALNSAGRRLKSQLTPFANGQVSGGVISSSQLQIIKQGTHAERVFFVTDDNVVISDDQTRTNWHIGTNHPLAVAAAHISQQGENHVQGGETRFPPPRGLGGQFFGNRPPPPPGMLQFEDGQRPPPSIMNQFGRPAPRGPSNAASPPPPREMRPPGEALQIKGAIIAFVDNQPMLLSGIATNNGKAALIAGVRLSSDLARTMAPTVNVAGFDFSPDMHPDDRDISRQLIKTFDGKDAGSFTWFKSRPGDLVWRMVLPVIAMLGILLTIATATLTILIARQSRRLEKSEQQNRYLSLHDNLTGLANRTQFSHAFDAALKGVKDTPFTVLACDLDRFKSVNDTYGHAAGDIVIKTIADRLRTVVGSTGLVARTGGDEFVILLHELVDAPRLTVLTHQIIHNVCQPIDIGETQTDVGISIGIGIAGRDGSSAIALMAAADAALYVAKEQGRNRAIFAYDVHPAQARPNNKNAKTAKVA